MKKILSAISIITLLYSCHNSDDGKTLPKLQPEKPKDEKNIYTPTNNYNILDLKYYKGPMGNEFPKEAEKILIDVWGKYFQTSSIKTIEFKKDSIKLNFESNIDSENYKYIREKNTFYIYNRVNKKVELGRFDIDDNSIYINRYYQILSLKNKEMSSLFGSKTQDFGKLDYKDVFPRYVSDPKKLIDKNEYIFWSNIEYKFSK